MHEPDRRGETTAGLRDTPPGRRGRTFRRLGFLLLALVVVAAALDLLGPRTADTTVRAADLTLSVEYTQVTRAGQPAPLNLRVSSSTSLPRLVQVRLCDRLFDDLDFQNWYPNPAAETGSSRAITYEFETPPGSDTLEVSLDARTAPGQFGETSDCEVSVLEDDTPVVATTITTWRMP